MDVMELKGGSRRSLVTTLLVLALMAAFFVGRATAPLATTERRGAMPTQSTSLRFVETDHRAAVIHRLTGQAVAHAKS
jgi:hypothetical protein